MHRQARHILHSFILISILCSFVSISGCVTRTSQQQSHESHAGGMLFSPRESPATWATPPEIRFQGGAISLSIAAQFLKE